MGATRGLLYVVATPIGNLEDITLRAVRILREADVIAAEDTRHTRKLLAHLDIHTPLTSFHAHSGTARLERILRTLEDGKSVALVTDAGTPGIADPGQPLIAAAVERRDFGCPGAGTVGSRCCRVHCRVSGEYVLLSGIFASAVVAA